MTKRQRGLVAYITENPGCTGYEAARAVAGAREYYARIDLLALRTAGIVVPSGTTTERGGEGLMLAANVEAA